MKNSFFTPKKFLIYSKINKNNVHGNILIIDTIGDLKSIYNYSDLSYVGGGMGLSGLHNILEACVYRTPVIIGKNYSGFIEAEDLVELGRSCFCKRLQWI